jgi:hypothetical protein
MKDNTMKKIIKHVSSCLWLILILSATLFWGCSCETSKPIPDPLADFKIDFNHEPDKVIASDYQSYLQNLPLEEKKHAVVGHFFEDGTGRHAVRIEVALNGTDWAHVLIYDRDDKRIKVIKYASGHYRS